MQESGANHYERAFENWLRDRRVEYLRADEHERIGPGPQSVKNFDFLLYLGPERRVIVEVKGRTFQGTSLAPMTGLECWVTLDDVESLRMWQEALGADHEAIFVFAYRIEHLDVDLDGREAFSAGPDRYVFFYVRLDDYRHHMKRRSPKWQTVTLPADAFRGCARELARLLR
ncbi:MAG: HYExAFE family protein [Phycisphaerales bacterium]|nr:MAG: HYExAFE family protein [Phycisphaerales bacterium]